MNDPLFSDDELRRIRETFYAQHQGRREDSVSFSELVAGICLGLVFVGGIAAWLLR